MRNEAVTHHAYKQEVNDAEWTIGAYQYQQHLWCMGICKALPGGWHELRESKQPAHEIFVGSLIALFQAVYRTKFLFYNLVKTTWLVNNFSRSLLAANWKFIFAE